MCQQLLLLLQLDRYCIYHYYREILVFCLKKGSYIPRFILLYDEAIVPEKKKRMNRKILPKAYLRMSQSINLIIINKMNERVREKKNETLKLYIMKSDRKYRQWVYVGVYTLIWIYYIATTQYHRRHNIQDYTCVRVFKCVCLCVCEI